MAAPVRVTFLGGLGDIGRNCAVIETEGRMVLLDCGQMFPDETMPGVDTVLPDFSFLRDRLDRIEACIVTHGHEDHIGALPHLLREASFPLYGSKFTLGLARNKIIEAGLVDRTEFIPVTDGERRPIGPFDVEFIPVTHSVPLGLISAISTPQGVILHSSDFKLDLEPLDGRLTDLRRIGALSSDPGIRLLLADSTNADIPGRTQSETAIGPALLDVFRSNVGRRIITACFSSHIHRVQQIADAALASGRRISTLGLSMKRNVTLARELGLLRIPDPALLDISEVDELDPGEVCVISTGSQAEERSALALASAGESRWIRLGSDDTVVLSSDPIPGNEAAVARMIDNLVGLGAKVLHGGRLGLHTSGHGKADELRTLHSVVRPDWMVPVHGEYHHLVAHGDLAVSMGMHADRVVVAVDGDQVVLTDSGLELRPGVAGGQHAFVHGLLAEPSERIFATRSILGREGFVVAIATVDLETLELIGTPRLESRGWVNDETFTELESDAREEVAKGLLTALDEGVDEVTELERRIRRSLGELVSNRTGRRPMLVPVIVSI